MFVSEKCVLMFRLEIIMKKIVSFLVIGALCTGNQGFCAVSALKSPLRNRAISNKTSVKAKTNVKQNRVKISKRKSYRKNLRNFARKARLKTKLALKRHKKLLSLGTSAIAAGSVFAYRFLGLKKNPSVEPLTKVFNNVKPFPLETCLVITGAPICILGVACMLKKTDNTSTLKKTPDPSNQPYYPNGFNSTQGNTSNTSNKPEVKPNDNGKITEINQQFNERLGDLSNQNSEGSGNESNTDSKNTDEYITNLIEQKFGNVPENGQTFSDTLSDKERTDDASVRSVSSEETWPEIDLTSFFNSEVMESIEKPTTSQQINGQMSSDTLSDEEKTDDASVNESVSSENPESDVEPIEEPTTSQRINGASEENNQRQRTQTYPVLTKKNQKQQRQRQNALKKKGKRVHIDFIPYSQTRDAVKKAVHQ